MVYVTTAAPSAPVDRAGASAFSEATVPVPEGLAGYRELGSGDRAIVLLHGISSGAGSWSECAAALARHTRVVAWDAPGYGASTALQSATPTASEYAARLHQLLEALKIRRCLLVGHS